MLAPFFVTLLTWSFAVLAAGWFVDVVSGWYHAGQRGSVASKRSMNLPVRIQRHLPFASNPHCTASGCSRAGDQSRSE